MEPRLSTNTQPLNTLTLVELSYAALNAADTAGRLRADSPDWAEYWKNIAGECSACRTIADLAKAKRAQVTLRLITSRSSPGERELRIAIASDMRLAEAY